MNALLLLLFLATATESRWINYECFIQLDLTSCLSYGVSEVQIEINPYGPTRTHRVNEDFPLVCHPMKCVAGFSTEDVSLIARAVLGNYESPLITQPTGFQEHASFYTSLEKCYNGAKNVTVNCPSTFQAAFYSQSYMHDSSPMECGSNEALYPVSKHLANEMETQKWEFQCKTSTKLSHSSCQWTEKVNSWEANTFYQCPLNSVVTGLKTYYDNENEQPHFQFKCCFTPNYSTTGCKLSEPNEYPPQDYMLVGAYVAAKDSRNEKVWQFLSCNYISSRP